MLSRSKPMRRTYRPTGPDAATVELVLRRAGHSCEVCMAPCTGQRGIHYHLHHRRPRGMGGTDRPETNQPPNLLLLCAYCHSVIESTRYNSLHHGWLVPQTLDPARVAVLITRDRWRYLTADGSYSLHPPQEVA